MKRIQNLMILALCAVYASPMAFAQQENTQKENEGTTTTEQNDSTSVTLEEVVVEGKMQYFTEEKAVFLPTKRQKNISNDAISLLRNMATTKIIVSPFNEVTTTSGQPISLFVDYMPAEDMDIKGMRTQDVVRVEYYDYPTDPRFRGAEHVVNYIMHKYEYGGYTKLNGSHSLTNSGNYSINSKMSYKKMVYDLYLGTGLDNINHLGDDVTTLYRFPTQDGGIYEVERDEAIESSKYKAHNYSGAFRAVYNTQKTSISNMLKVGNNHVNANNTSGTLKFHPAIFDASTYTDNTSSQSSWIGWDGEYFFALPKNYLLNISGSLYHTHGKTWRTYVSPGATDIMTNTRENALNSHLNFNLTKKITDNHTLYLLPAISYNNNDIEYYGTLPSHSKISTLNEWLLLGYRFSLNKFRADIRTGIMYSEGKSNGIKTTNSLLSLKASAAYTFSDKSSISFFASTNSNSIPSSIRSQSTVMLNEIEAITGNPNLKRPTLLHLSINYDWMPTNIFSFSAFVGYHASYRQWVPVWEADSENMVMIRSYTNSGEFTRASIGANLSTYLINRTLVLQLIATQHFFKRTGLYSKTHNPIEFYVTANYSIGNFYMRGYYQWRTNNLMQDGSIYKQVSVYSISGGWGNGNWNVALSLNNIFRKSWKYGYTVFDESPNYSSMKSSYSPICHADIELAVSYTFGYGKKIRRGNDIQGASSGTSSAILN